MLKMATITMALTGLGVWLLAVDEYTCISSKLSTLMEKKKYYLLPIQDGIALVWIPKESKFHLTK